MALLEMCWGPLVDPGPQVEKHCSKRVDEVTKKKKTKPDIHTSTKYCITASIQM